MRGARAAAAVITALAAGCASGPSGEPPLELRRLMQRELELPKVAPVATADGSVRARVAGRLVGELTRTPDHTWFGSFDIGARSPVQCHVFDEQQDPASTLVKMSENVLGATGTARKIDRREILSVDAGHVGPHPYLGLDWIATIDGLSYQVKQKFATRGDRSLYCLHDETGYAQAFDRFFAGFVGSLEVEEEDAPIYREVVVVSIGGQEVGYQATSVTRDADGDYRSHAHGATIIPAAADQAIASDDQQVEFSRADGTVINQVWTSSDGKDLTQFDLRRREGVWTVTGQMQGKPVSERFAAELTSGVQESRLIMRVARGELGEARYARWLGTLSPGKPLDHVMTKIGSASVRVAAGPVKVEVEVDERAPKRGVLHVGRLEMVMERVYVDGSL